ncbi:MAG: hypothetical protein V3R85_08805 [Alphaproteobacteria bacterium]
MKALKALVIIMAVLIAAGLTVLVVMVVKNAGKDAPPSTAAGGSSAPLAATSAPGFGETGINLPPGAAIIETSTGDGRIVLRIRQPDGGQALVVIDAATGRRLGLVRLKDGEPTRP